MEAGKYISSLGGDISTRKPLGGKKWKKLKWQSALALTVSLWMAGGLVASAGQTTTIQEGENYEGIVYGNHIDGNVEAVDQNADPNNNTVTMTGGNVIGNNGAVFGAFCDESKSSASGNQVIVSGGKIGYNELAGASAYDTTTTHDLKNNTVTVKGSADIQADIDGAMTNNGSADSNHVIIEGGTVNKENGSGAIYGGRSNANGDATNNTVTISSGTIKANTITGGGSTVNGNATNNTVTISGGDVIAGWLVGGYIGTSNTGGKATGNRVTVSSDVTGTIYGGYRSGLGTGETAENKVTINGVKVTGDVYGGYTWSGTGAVNNNMVMLTGATVTGNVYGGGTKEGTGDLVTGNTLKLSGVSSVGSTVGNFATIEFDSSKLTWNTTNPVLKAQSFDNCDVLDVSGVQAMTGTDSGTMTLLKATGAALPAFTLAYTGTSGKTTAALNSENSSVKVKEGADETNTESGVGITYKNTHTVALANSNKDITYSIDNYANKITLGTIVWNKNGTARALTAGEFIFNDATTIDEADFEFNTPTNIVAGDSMTMLSNVTGFTAGADIAVSQSYTHYVNGINLNATLNGNITKTADTLGYTATANQANKLTFGDVEWKDSGALIDHAATLSNVSFNGADVDTSGINFTNISELAANKKMTLVSSFGDSVGTIIGTKYKVGSTLEGEGTASLSGNDLVFSTSTAVGAASDSSESGSGSGDTGSDSGDSSGSGGSAESGGSSGTGGSAGSGGSAESGSGSGDTGSGSGGSSSSGGSSELTVQEQTHNTVMGAEVSMAALSAGNEFVGAATEGLALAGNAGADGMATFAKMGGGTMRQETGSHVDTHTWNAILALGHKNDKKLSSTEYGVFFEYGKGTYSTFNGDERGDGSTRYTGGGILGKWKKNNGFYVEGSLRVGSIHDDAANVLRDAAGKPYSYNTDAAYWGAHIGAGREIKLNKADILDLYAKYFYNHRGSVSFDAGGHYALDAVESSVLRIGTRYTVKKSDKVNYYGGLAVEHEFCGRATGFADGVAIRGADISGTSVRGEIGATFRPGERGNVTLDLNISGFAGKKQGFTGGFSAVFHI